MKICTNSTIGTILYHKSFLKISPSTIRDKKRPKCYRGKLMIVVFCTINYDSVLLGAPLLLGTVHALFFDVLRSVTRIGIYLSGLPAGSRGGELLCLELCSLMEDTTPILNRRRGFFLPRRPHGNHVIHIGRLYRIAVPRPCFHQSLALYKHVAALIRRFRFIL